MSKLLLVISASGVIITAFPRCKNVELKAHHHVVLIYLPFSYTAASC